MENAVRNLLVHWCYCLCVH